MKTETIRTITIEDFKSDPHLIDYVDENLIILDSVEATFRKFLERVAEDDGTHRSVTYYADLLCYSAKHLSTVVKKISGKAPLSIINEHAIEQIKYELKHSDMSIKEIADHFDFVNPSFFGKFVKQHLGMSPLQFRNSEEKE